MPNGFGKDPGDWKQVKNLQEGSRKQAVNTDRRLSQMVDQMAHLAGSMKRMEGLLRPAPTATGS